MSKKSKKQKDEREIISFDHMDALNEAVATLYEAREIALMFRDVDNLLVIANGFFELSGRMSGLARMQEQEEQEQEKMPFGFVGSQTYIVNSVTDEIEEEDDD